MVTKWLCRCECGHEALVGSTDLRRGKSTQCRFCYGTDKKDLVGQKIHDWTILERAESQFNRAYYKCQCSCGSIHVVCQQTLINGSSTRCNQCHIEENCTDHGHCRRNEKHPLYTIWMGILARCENPKCHAYRLYGARGIKICDEWKDLNRFYDDMGDRPSLKHSIDRIDVDGDYCKKNCRWSTYTAQGRNRRNNIRFEKNGMNITLGEWAEYFGVNDAAIRKLTANKGFDHAYCFYSNKMQSLR